MPTDAAADASDPRPRSHTLPRRLWAVAQIALGLCLLGWLLSGVELAELRDLLAQGDAHNARAPTRPRPTMKKISPIGGGDCTPRPAPGAPVAAQV